MLLCTSANFFDSEASVSWILFTFEAINSSVCRIQNWSICSFGGLTSSNIISSVLIKEGPMLALATQLSRHADKIARNWWSAARASWVLVLKWKKSLSYKRVHKERNNLKNTTAPSCINLQLHYDRIKCQNAYPELRSYTWTCKLGCC